MLALLLRLQADEGAGRRVFAGIVEQIEQHLLEQHDDRASASADPAAGRPRRDAAPGSGRPAPGRCRRSPTDRPCWLRGTTAPDSSRVMSRRLPMKRLSRSASSWMVPISSSLPLRRAHRARSSGWSPSPRIEASGVRRSCEIEVSSAERSRSVSAASRARSTSSGEADSLDGKCCLIAERVEQAPLIGRSAADPAARCRGRRPPTAPAAGPHRQEEPLGPGSVSAPRPAARLFSQHHWRRRDRLRQAVLRRIARARTNRSPSSGSSSTTRTFSIRAI